MIILEDKFSSLSKKYTVYRTVRYDTYRINKIYRYSRYRIRTRAVQYLHGYIIYHTSYTVRTFYNKIF